MNEYSLKSNIRNYRFISNIIIVFVVFLLLTITVVFRNNASDDKYFSIDYSDRWSYENGSLVDFDNLQFSHNNITIHKRIDSYELSTKTLCFYSKNIYFSVYLNNDMIYDYHPKSPAIFGKAYGIYPHSVTLPVVASGGNFYIAIDNIYPDENGYLRDITLENGNTLIINEIQTTTYEFIICIISLTFGLVIFLVGLAGRYFGDRRYEIVSMGAFTMTASLWILSETETFTLITNSPTAVHFVDYISLDMFAYPGVVFVAYITGNKRSRLPIIIGITSTIKIIYSIISTVSGGKDYHQLLIFTQINLAIAAVLVTDLIVVGLIKKRIEKKVSVILITVLIFSILLGIIDIMKYMYANETFYAFSFYKVALFLFILMSGFYEFLNISEMSRLGRYAEIMEELAYKDGLTGILNRKAYNEEIEKATKEKKTCALIMLDMNYLKKVNDLMGHNMGDKYLSSIAEIITNSFIHGEKCFRIGGDEFFVMSSKESKNAVVIESMNRLMKNVDDFNKNNMYSIPLSVAYGIADYNPATDNIDDKIKLADQLMYEMKLDMKSAR